jgi:hypothetical protein
MNTPASPPISLDTTAGVAFCAQLRLALRALRLNRYYPAWRALSDHLSGVALFPSNQASLGICATTGWPHPQEWLRFRIDHKLGPELLAHIEEAAAAGDRLSADKAAYFHAIQKLSPMMEPPIQVGLIHTVEGPDGPQARFEILIDRWEPGAPSFVRWTLRVLDLAPGRRVAIEDLHARATERFERRLQVLAAQPALSAWTVFWEDPEIRIEELVRGEIGPVVHGAHGPRLSATLTRIANHLSGVRVDDPLRPKLRVPEVDPDTPLRFGMSHNRKWAVPAKAQPAHQAWLESQGSKNIHYAYST